MNVTATLARPLPLLGLRSQRLGTVQRLRLALESRRIVEIELCTPWQTLRLSGDRVVYDARRQVFRIARPDPDDSRQASVAPLSSS